MVCVQRACRPTAFQLPHDAHKTPAWRIIVPDETLAFADEIVGHYAQNLARDIGDFVLLRADGHWAYQLAVVVDDAAQGITHIVRGKICWCHPAPNLPATLPERAHAALRPSAAAGERARAKMEQQTLAPALDLAATEALLRQVCAYLNIPPAPEVNRPSEVLDWAVANWNMARVPKQAICTE